MKSRDRVVPLEILEAGQFTLSPTLDRRVEYSLEDDEGGPVSSELLPLRNILKYLGSQGLCHCEVWVLPPTYLIIAKVGRWYTFKNSTRPSSITKCAEQWVSSLLPSSLPSSLSRSDTNYRRTFEAASHSPSLARKKFLWTLSRTSEYSLGHNSSLLWRLMSRVGVRVLRRSGRVSCLRSSLRKVEGMPFGQNRTTFGLFWGYWVQIHR